MPRVYLDHAATTQPDPRVLEAMWDAYARTWGNPSSIYLEGQQARHVLDEARRICVPSDESRGRRASGPLTCSDSERAPRGCGGSL